MIRLFWRRRRGEKKYSKKKTFFASFSTLPPFFSLLFSLCVSSKKQFKRTTTRRRNDAFYSSSLLAIPHGRAKTQPEERGETLSISLFWRRQGGEKKIQNFWVSLFRLSRLFFVFFSPSLFKKNTRRDEEATQNSSLRAILNARKKTSLHAKTQPEREREFQSFREQRSGGEERDFFFSFSHVLRVFKRRRRRGEIIFPTRDFSDERIWNFKHTSFACRERERTTLSLAIVTKEEEKNTRDREEHHVERERSVRGGSVRDEGVKLVPKESEWERSVDGFRGTVWCDFEFSFSLSREREFKLCVCFSSLCVMFSLSLVWRRSNSF